MTHQALLTESERFGILKSIIAYSRSWNARPKDHVREWAFVRATDGQLLEYAIEKGLSKSA